MPASKAPAVKQPSAICDSRIAPTRAIQLPLNTPRTLDVTINPTTVGAHSAILNLNDPNTVGIDYQTMNVVVVPEEFVSGSNYTQTHTDTIGRNEVKRYFFAVPSGTPAFKVDLMGGGSTPGAGQIRFLRFHPYGVSLEDNSSLSCYNPDSGGGCPGGPSSRTVSNPTPGVWEIIVEARRTSDTANAPFTLTASILGATVSPNPDTITSATIGMPVARSYTLNNIYGDFTGRAEELEFHVMPRSWMSRRMPRPGTVRWGSCRRRSFRGHARHCTGPAATLNIAPRVARRARSAPRLTLVLAAGVRTWRPST